MEWLYNLIIELNNYAGLFSLLALLAAIIVPFSIYRKNKQDARQDAIDELEVRKNFSWSGKLLNDKDDYIRENLLKKKANRK